MTMPMWVFKCDDVYILREAIAEAWEALEHQKISRQLEVSWYKWRANEAVRRIESLGESK